MALATRPDAMPVAGRVYPQNLMREYVVDGRLGAYIQHMRAMPWAVDDLTGDLGDDLYERMQRDPQVRACITIWKASIIEDGATLSPAINDEANPDYETAREISDAAVEMLENLDTPFDDVLWNMLDACALGNKVAELVWQVVDTTTGPRLDLRAIKPKPRRMVAFVVDPFMNIVGIAGQQANSMGLGLPSPGAYIANPQYLLPREKFAVLTFRPENNDPRGTSLLRAAYDPWVRKRQVLPEYVKYLAQFATPGLIGTVGPDADDAPDPDKPEQTITPEEALARTLSSFANSVAIALPDGTQVKVVESQGEGAAILNALAHCDQQIVVGILAQTLATMEGEHQARAAAMVHLEVLDTVVRQAKKSVVRMIRADILRQWVLYNWGPTYLPLVPRCTLTSTEQRQKPALMQAVSQLVTSGYVQADQYPAMDEMLGLPPRDLAILATLQANQIAATEPAPPPEPVPPPAAEGGAPAGASAEPPPAAAPAA